MSLEPLLAVGFLRGFLLHAGSFALLLCFAFQFNPLTFAISSSSHSCLYFSAFTFSCRSLRFSQASFNDFECLCPFVDLRERFKL